MVFALVFGVLLVSCPAFAVQGGFSRPYTHYADDEDLTVILTNFARSQGLGASFSPGVVGKVSGRFDAVPPETFLKGMQAAFGVTSRWLDETTLALPGRQHYRPCDYDVEGDYSQAAFPAVLGAVTGGVTLTGLAEPTLQGDAAILDILRRCGADFSRTEQGIVFRKAPLHGTDIDLADCPDLGPVLMVLGLFCEGQTVIRNAERLRIKESDRIEAMETELRKCGGVLSSAGGTITIEGCAGALHAPDGVLSGHNDHRVVMSLSVLALAAGLRLPIDGAEAITKSWPNFFTAIKPLGAEVEDVG